MRRTTHRVQEQLKDEGLTDALQPMDAKRLFRITLVESTPAKNALLSVSGESPHRVHHGPAPNLLPSADSLSMTPITDTESDPLGSRATHRVREMTVQLRVEHARDGELN